MIEQETVRDERQPLTNIKPWSEKELRAAYKRSGGEWDALEEAATRAQGKPDFND